MTEYVPDAQRRWAAIVRGDATLLVAVPTADLLDDLWAALVAPDATAAVLGRLTRDGLADLKPFALVVRGRSSVRVVVRGGFRVRVDADVLTGEEVSTWVERSFPGADAVEIVAPYAAASADDRSWPISEAAVPAVAVRWGAGIEAPVIRPDAIVVPSEPVHVESGEVAASAAADVAAPLAADPIQPAGHASAPGTTMIPDATLVPGATIVPDATLVPPVDGRTAGFEPAPADSGEIEDRTVVVERPARPQAAAPGLASEPVGDHDGSTVVVADIRRLRAAQAAGADEASAGAPGPEPVSRPDVRLRLPDGSEETLTGEIVLGRSPSVSRISGARLPRLVTVGHGDPDISRSHVRIGLEGGTVVVTDLHSRNGTNVVQPGRAPVKLRPGEPTPVLSGTVVELGGGCTIAVVEEQRA